MLEKLTLQDFLPERGKRFRVDRGDAPPIELVLDSASDLTSGDGRPRRAPFSLVFRGPLEPALAQRIWALEPVEKSELPRLEIFLVPIGPEAGGMRYEAIFN